MVTFTALWLKLRVVCVAIQEVWLMYSLGRISWAAQGWVKARWSIHEKLVCHTSLHVGQTGVGRLGVNYSWKSLSETDRLRSSKFQSQILICTLPHRYSGLCRFRLIASSLALHVCEGHLECSYMGRQCFRKTTSRTTSRIAHAVPVQKSR